MDEGGLQDLILPLTSLPSSVEVDYARYGTERVKRQIHSQQLCRDPVHEVQGVPDQAENYCVVEHPDFTKGQL